MVATAVLLPLTALAIWRLFGAGWDRTRLLVILAVVAGWLLLAVPGVDWLVRAGGKPVVELVRQVGYVLSPFALLAGAGWGLGGWPAAAGRPGLSLEPPGAVPAWPGASPWAC
jgi:hypothetical protein